MELACFRGRLGSAHSDEATLAVAHQHHRVGRSGAREPKGLEHSLATGGVVTGQPMDVGAEVVGVGAIPRRVELPVLRAGDVDDVAPVGDPARVDGGDHAHVDLALAGACAR